MTNYVKYKPVECGTYTGSIYHALSTRPVNTSVLQGQKRRRRPTGHLNGAEWASMESLIPSPEEMAIVKLDKCCPRCESNQSNGLDIGIEDGEVFGCRCTCGFSF